MRYRHCGISNSSLKNLKLFGFHNTDCISFGFRTMCGTYRFYYDARDFFPGREQFVYRKSCSGFPSAAKVFERNIGENVQNGRHDTQIYYFFFKFSPIGFTNKTEHYTACVREEIPADAWLKFTNINRHFYVTISVVFENYFWNRFFLFFEYFR